MIEKRQFHRVRLSAKSELGCHDINFQGHLENISINGALVRFDQDVIVPIGGECVLTIFLEGDSDYLRFHVEVVHATHSLAGMRFVHHEADTLLRLGKLVETATTEPIRLRAEMEKIRGLITDYLG